MDRETKLRFEARADIIKAMAHPTRLFIVEELKKERRSVGELTDMVGADTSTVSKHLSVLKNAGLVVDEKEGTTVYYSLLCPCILDFIGCIEAVLATTADRQAKVVASCKLR